MSRGCWGKKTRTHARRQKKLVGKRRKKMSVRADTYPPFPVPYFLSLFLPLLFPFVSHYSLVLYPSYISYGAPHPFMVDHWEPISKLSKFFLACSVEFLKLYRGSWRRAREVEVEAEEEEENGNRADRWDFKEKTELKWLMYYKILAWTIFQVGQNVLLWNAIYRYTVIYAYLHVYL